MSVEIGADAAGTAPSAGSASVAVAPEASASPFTMLPGAAGAMVCEGDACYVPGLSAE